MAVQLQQFIFNIQLSFLWPWLCDIWSALEHTYTVFAPFYLKSKFHRTSLIAYFHWEQNKVKFSLKNLLPEAWKRLNYMMVFFHNKC